MMLGNKDSVIWNRTRCQCSSGSSYLEGLWCLHLQVKSSWTA